MAPASLRAAAPIALCLELTVAACGPPGRPELLAAGAGCDAGSRAVAALRGDAAAPEEGVTLATRATGLALAPARVDADAGSAGGAALQVMTWNLDWLGDPEQGPSDDALQQAAVRDVLARSQMQLIALQEVASEPAFDDLLRALPRYAGLLSGYAWTQRTALLWDARRFELGSARALSGLDDAGRPPLLVCLRAKPDGVPLRVLVVHAKAQADAASYDRRARFAEGLKAFADGEPLDAPLLVLGDFNDLLLGSISEGEDTPYRAFLDDPSYDAPTRALDEPGASEASYAHGRTIDHVLLRSAGLLAVRTGSVDVLQDELLARYPDYITTVSDHFPVTLTLQP